MRWYDRNRHDSYNRRVAAIDSMADALTKLRGYNATDVLDAATFLYTSDADQAYDALWGYLWPKSGKITVPAIAPKILAMLAKLTACTFGAFGTRAHEQDLLQIVDSHPLRSLQIVAARAVALQASQDPLPAEETHSPFESSKNQALLDAAEIEKTLWATPVENQYPILLSSLDKKVAGALKELLLSPEPGPGNFQAEDSVYPSKPAQALGTLLEQQPSKTDAPALLECWSRYAFSGAVLGGWLAGRKEISLAGVEKQQMASISKLLIDTYAKRLATRTSEFPDTAREMYAFDASSVFSEMTMEEAEFMGSLLTPQSAGWPDDVRAEMNKGFLFTAYRRKEWKKMTQILSMLPGPHRRRWTELLLDFFKTAAGILSVYSSAEKETEIEGIRAMGAAVPYFLEQAWDTFPDDRKFVLVEANGRNMPSTTLRQLAEQYGEDMGKTVEKILKERNEPLSPTPEPREM